MRGDEKISTLEEEISPSMFAKATSLQKKRKLTIRKANSMIGVNIDKIDAKINSIRAVRNPINERTVKEKILSRIRTPKTITTTENRTY